jgi:hypothetical protein
MSLNYCYHSVGIKIGGGAVWHICSIPSISLQTVAVLGFFDWVSASFRPTKFWVGHLGSYLLTLKIQVNNKLTVIYTIPNQLIPDGKCAFNVTVTLKLAINGHKPG